MSIHAQTRRLDRRREERAQVQQAAPALIQSPNELKAVWAAVAQYVENGITSRETEDPHRADPLLAPAEAVLERLDTAVAALAE